jgi:hypothetical protein
MNIHNIPGTETILRNRAPLSSVGALSVEELNAFSDNNCEERGAWLDVFCPEDRCLLEEERIRLVDFCEESSENLHLWHDVFCPRGSCEIFEASQLP